MTSMTLPTQHSNVHLGSQSLDLILKSLNTGLNTGHLQTHNLYAYTFTRALVHDLWETFGQQHTHGLFLCGWEHVIDMYFQARCDAHVAGILPTPGIHRDCAFVNNSHSLKEYLQHALREAQPLATLSCDLTHPKTAWIIKGNNNKLRVCGAQPPTALLRHATARKCCPHYECEP